jgi:hypothetical protein
MFKQLLMQVSSASGNMQERYTLGAKNAVHV